MKVKWIFVLVVMIVTIALSGCAPGASSAGRTTSPGGTYQTGRRSRTNQTAGGRGSTYQTGRL